MSCNKNKTTAELRALLANYEQRMVDSAEGISVRTARLMSRAIRELHAEIGLRSQEQGLALENQLRRMALAIRHNVAHRADFTACLTGYVELYDAQYQIGIRPAWIHGTVQALATEIFETRATVPTLQIPL